jgi:hypothetical protein
VKTNTTYKLSVSPASRCKQEDADMNQMVAQRQNTKHKKKKKRKTRHEVISFAPEYPCHTSLYLNSLSLKRYHWNGNKHKTCNALLVTTTTLSLVQQFYFYF